MVSWLAFTTSHQSYSPLDNFHCIELYVDTRISLIETLSHSLTHPRTSVRPNCLNIYLKHIPHSLQKSSPIRHFMVVCSCNHSYVPWSSYILAKAPNNGSKTRDHTPWEVYTSCDDMYAQPFQSVSGTSDMALLAPLFSPRLPFPPQYSLSHHSAYQIACMSFHYTTAADAYNTSHIRKRRESSSDLNRQTRGFARMCSLRAGTSGSWESLPSCVGGRAYYIYWEYSISLSRVTNSERVLPAEIFSCSEFTNVSMVKFAGT